MSTTPLDLDSIRARHEVALRWLREGYSYDDNFNQAALLVRDDVPALLDELATERRQGAAMASITGEAIRQISEERDAARKELAKTAALLERAQNELNAYRRGDLPHVVLEEVRRLDSERTAELAKTRAELDEIKGKIAHPTVAGVLDLVALCEHRWHAAEAAHDAKDEANRRWLEAELAREALANPATTAGPADVLPLLPDIAHMATPLPDDDEPADEPKATCSCKWSPIQGRIWCDPCTQADACNCQTTNGGGPWHPRGDTPTCPDATPAQVRP